MIINSLHYYLILGGAFLIPYLVVLVLVGRPLYYLEMIVGQFSSRSSVKVFNMVPGLRGKCYIKVSVHIYIHADFFSKIEVEMIYYKKSSLTSTSLISLIFHLIASFRIRYWCWSSDCSFYTQYILCINYGTNRPIFIRFI